MEMLLLVFLILAGAGLAKLKLLKQSHITWATRWIIYVALPAVALAKLPKLDFGLEMIAPALSAFVIFGGSAFLFLVILKNKFSRDQRIVLTIVSGLGNTSFIGFPLIKFYYGADYLPMAVIFDQGSFFLFATAAQFLIATRSGSYNPINSLKKIASFPPFLGLIAALLIPSEWIFGWHEQALTFLGSTISPVAMIVVGFQIARFVNFHFTEHIFYGLSYKLIASPIIIWALMNVLDVSDMIFKTSVFEASMAPMITPAILLTDYRIERQLTAQLLCWGIFASFFTSAIVYYLL